MERHFDGNGWYLLTRVEHEATQGGLRSGEEIAFSYENRFRCLPAALPYRPARRTPKPTIPGTQTAMVVGPKESEICVDQFGRVKVQFPWDRHGTKNMDSSCWLRVAQVWAGQGWGACFWPRVGHEVVVSFTEGDPDRPLVVGSVYNETSMPGLGLPPNAAVSGFTTQVFRAEDRSDAMEKLPAVPSHSGLLIGDLQAHVEWQRSDEIISHLRPDDPDISYVVPKEITTDAVVHLCSAGDIAINAEEDLRLIVPDEMTTNVLNSMWTSVGGMVIGLPKPGWKKGKLEWEPGPVQSSGGERWDILYGQHIIAEGLLSNHYTIFSRNEIVFDPWTGFVESVLGRWKWAAKLLVGKVPSGRTEATYGARNTTGTGPVCWTQHGPVLSRVAPSKPWEDVWTVGHIAATMALYTLASIYAGSANKKLFYCPLFGPLPFLGNSIVGWVDHAAGLCLALTNHLNRDWAIHEALKDSVLSLAPLADKLPIPKLLTLIEADMEAHAKYALKLELPGVAVDNRTVEGTSALQADRVQILGRDEGVSITSLNKGSTVLVSEKAIATMVGVSHVLVERGEVDVSVGVAPAENNINVAPTGITLSCGENCKITMGPTSITLKAGATSLELGPAGVQINGPNLGIDAPGFKLTKAGLYVTTGMLNLKGKIVAVTSEGPAAFKGKIVNVG
jgi:hypothetical protein